VLGIRPEGLTFADGGPVKATVSVVEALGHERHVMCRLEDGQLVIARQAVSDPPPAVQGEVGFTVDSANLHVFDAETEERVDA
jgi:multiple sugar transport system ATP-binding protein